MNFFWMAGIVAALTVGWMIYSIIAAQKKVLNIVFILSEEGFISEDMYFDRHANGIAFDHSNRQLTLFDKNMRFVIFPNTWLISYEHTTKTKMLSKKLNHVLSFHVEQPSAEQTTTDATKQLVHLLTELEFEEFPEEVMEKLSSLKK